MRHCPCALVLLLGCLLAPETANSTGGAPPPRLQPAFEPVDQAALHPEFFSFRARLLTTIARRDRNELLAAIDPKVRTSFGDVGGIDEFRRVWKLEGKNERTWGASRIWEELGAVLALGGTFDPRRDGNFVAPYVFSRWPEKYDAFEHVAIIASRVRVRSAPRSNAGVLGQLSFTIVPLAKLSKPLPQGSLWTAVKLRDGRTGYVSTAFTRSPVGYRAIFARTGGLWRLATFVAGD